MRKLRVELRGTEEWLRKLSMSHYTDDELTLYHYGEAPRRDRIDQHLQACESCAATYRDLARTLALVGDLDVPERDERYGLEVWQRIRHDLPPQEAPCPLVERRERRDPR